MTPTRAPVVDLEAVEGRCEAATRARTSIASLIGEYGRWCSAAGRDPGKSWHVGGVADRITDALAAIDLSAPLVGALADLRAERAETAELRLTLLNERGVGEPPPGGWTFDESPYDGCDSDSDPVWTRATPIAGRYAVVWRGYLTPTSKTMTWFYAIGITGGTEGPTARECMTAANAVLSGESR